MNTLPAQIHVWNRCHGCGIQPIEGLRFECQTCPIGPDNDLCERCYEGCQRGAVKHPAPGSYAAHLGPPGQHIFEAYQGASQEQYLPWLKVPFPALSAPAVPDRFVVRPDFRCGLESFFGTYAFVAEIDGGKRLVLTALHVMDGLMKAKKVDCSSKNESYTGQELPRIVTRVDLYDVFAPNWMLAELGSAYSMLVLSDARTGEPEPFSQRDVAGFFPDPSARVAAVPLASCPPGVGEPIWLAVNPGPKDRRRAIEAVVVESSDRILGFRFAQSEIPTNGSGAPLLDREGRVVGINVGSGFLSGIRFGHAAHAGSIRRHLAQGAQK